MLYLLAPTWCVVSITYARMARLLFVSFCNNCVQLFFVAFCWLFYLYLFCCKVSIKWL